MRALTDEESQVLRGEISESPETNPALAEIRKNSGVKAILQYGGVRDSAALARVHRYSFPKMFSTSGSILNGQCELFVVPFGFVCALFHYEVDHSIPIPIGFISTSPERIKAAVELVRSLASGSNRLSSVRGDDAGPEQEFTFIMKIPLEEVHDEPRGGPDPVQP